jgi:cysteine-rich repeat protein
VAAFARLGGGVLGDLCGDLEAELGRILDAALGAPEVPVGGEPVPGTLEVRVNSQVVRRHAPPGTPGGWAYGIDARRIRFFPPDVPAARDAVEVAYDTRCDSGACGDGQLQAPEQCDDGNRVDTDACLACVDATCGDRVVWSGNEACDDGNVDPADACLPSCEAPRCGDGFVQRPGEDCDDGNTQPGDACPASCRFYTVSGPTRQRFQRLRTGTVLSFSGAPDPEDEGVATVTLPFSFELFGVATSTLTVSPNGVLAVGAASPDRLRANTVFPDARSPSGVIAPWWDDLIIDGGVSREGASVAYEIFGTAPRRTAVIQWRDLRLEDQSTGRHRRWRFQVQIDEATSEIRFHYGDTRQRGFNFPSTYSASVGLEAASGRVGVAGASCTPDCDGRPRRFDSRFDYPEGEVLTFTPAP